MTTSTATPRASVFFPPQQLDFSFSVPVKNTVTPREAAQILGCSMRQVYNYIDDGTLNALDISRKSAVDPSSERRHMRVATASIRSFLAARQTLTTGGGQRA